MNPPSLIKKSSRGALLPIRHRLWSNASSAEGPKVAHGWQLQPILWKHCGQSQKPRYSTSEPKTPFLSTPSPTLWNPYRRSSKISDGNSRFSTSLTNKRWTHSSHEGEQPTNSAHGLNHHLSSLHENDDQGSVDNHLETVRDPYMRGYAPPDGPELAVSDQLDDKNFPSFDEVTGASDEEQQIVCNLWRAIQHQLRNPYQTSAEHIYQLYLSLPEPRMLYLHAKIRHGLMRCLGGAKKEQKSMLRYFAVVADIKRCGLRFTRPEWNAAMSFAARYVGHSTATEVEAAMNLWKEMERDAGIKANAVTFNILFDVSSKAGNFVLAEMLYDEMKNRGLEYNRYHHVSLIHFFGLRMDSGGLRAAYKEMIQSGEMIDTTVLNCLMAGFLRCGEEYAAGRVYERMKEAHERAPAMPYRNYMNETVITKALMVFAKISRTEPDLWQNLQSVSPIVPNVQTYRILLNHYAVKVAALDKVANYLDDMRFFQIPLHGSIFLALFKGFAMYGAPTGSVWSPQRLVKVWEAFMKALDQKAHGLYVGVWLAKWILRAFRKCETDEQVWKTWQQLRPRCEIDFEPEEFDHFQDFLIHILRPDSHLEQYRDRGMFGCSGSWTRR